MNTNTLKRFAREARIKLLNQVSRKLEFVLTHDTAELRGKQQEIEQLKRKIAEQGKEQVIETVAYTWFNRLMALRFMDANGYTIPKVLTPLPGMTNPEILQNALGGSVEAELKLDRQRLNDLLDGKTAATDAHTEAYKMLLVASCNQWHTAMPFMFERISDYTELLLPDDLLSDYSIVADIRNGMSDEDCQQEELIGWLYQFYIADKKDDVFEGLKKNIKITAENIPAATQLFTPRWIVRYMVENTLGKLWLTLKPNSKLRQHMPYFIEAPEGTTPAPLPEGIKGVTDITFLDPCQGSGHVLVYAFDLFTKIYEEEGYNTNEIPALILQHNLFGIDIDERAAQLAAFALTMKARSYYPRFLRKPVQPHVIALVNVNEDIIKQAVKLPLQVAGKLVYDYRDLTLYNLTQADNFGSLIQIDPEELKALSIQKGSIWQEQEQKLKEQAEYLSRQYHCVVTNPPYMGQKGMNNLLRDFVETFFSDGKADLMTCFMKRCGEFIYDNCSYGMINLPSWLFITSFEAVRRDLLKNFHIDSLLHMGRGIFGIDFGSVAFSISKISSNACGKYFRLHQRNFQHIYFNHIEQLFLRSKSDPSFQYDFSEYRDSDGVSEIPFKSNKKGLRLFYEVNQNDFLKIPGSPFAFWINQEITNLFDSNNNITKYGIRPATGLQTGDNSKFIRFWYEVDKKKIRSKWVPLNNGGDVRKWYGNFLSVINWENDGEEIKSHKSSVIRNPNLYFKKGGTWNRISSTFLSLRYLPEGFIFDQSGDSFFANEDENIYFTLAFLNSNIGLEITKIICPTLNTTAGNFVNFPLPKLASESKKRIVDEAKKLVTIAKTDWDSSEKSWDFESPIFLNDNIYANKISDIGTKYKAYALELIKEMKGAEERINELFIAETNNHAFISSSVEIGKITLNINLLGEDESSISNLNEIYNEELVYEILRYSIGNIFGRLSLNSGGFVLANLGETLLDFLKQVPNPKFMPDEDNIIPVLDGEWFNDDIVGRFKVFLKAAFGEEHFEENLKYIEDTIGKDIRKYFVKDFYNDHIKRYKKRPIYWMFSSPKGHFKALIYMHRYQPDLCSKMLNDYLQAYISKLEAARQTQTMLTLREDLSAREKTAAIKEIDKLEGMLKDCREYEKTLFTIATQKISIDLDDGVKVNYQKFKEVLVPIKGLEKEEE